MCDPPHSEIKHPTSPSQFPPRSVYTGQEWVLKWRISSANMNPARILRPATARKHSWATMFQTAHGKSGNRHFFAWWQELIDHGILFQLGDRFSWQRHHCQNTDQEAESTLSPLGLPWSSCLWQQATICLWRVCYIWQGMGLWAHSIQTCP